MKCFSTVLVVMVATLAFGQGETRHPFMEDFLTKWDNAKEYTMDFANAMPAEHYDFRPTEGQRAFNEQITHICGNMIWLCTSYLGGAGLPSADTEEPPTSKEDVVKLLGETFDYVRTTLENFDYALIDEEVEFFAGPMSKRKVLFLISDHLTHHRGQLAVYLRLKDVEPPRYRGW